MNREIKFRAWDKKDGVMVAFDHSDFAVASERVRNYALGYDSEGNYRRQDNITYMQYTGLKDQHGNDLYEGDVCWLADNEIFGEVIWDEGAWCYHWDNIVENLHNCADSLELRGNIYENPELLEDGR